MTELHELTAGEAVRLLRARELTAMQLLEATLARIELLDDRLHAWALLDPDGARAAAERCDRALNAGEDPGLLAGLCLGIKDIYWTAGLQTSAASPILADFVPEHDAHAVELLRAAGAIVIGKTVTTQFADGDPPPTSNPWHPDRTPGGSSSGSAAAVAARMVSAALGSQTAGSVLRPAAYCGVVGLKPTFGRISRRGVFPFAWSLDTMGVITRDVADAALLLQALAAFDPLDDGSGSHSVDDYQLAARSPRAPRLALVRDFLDRAQPDVRLGLQTAVAAFEAAGAEITEVRYPIDLDLALAVQHLISVAEAAELHSRTFDARPAAYAPRLRSMIQAGALVPASAYVRAQRWRRRLRQEMNRQLAGFDAYLLPTASNVAPGLDTTGDTSFQAIWTLLGLPAISLPSGLSAERLPLAVQLVSKPWDESGLLSVARWCETVLGPAAAPPC